MKTLEEVAQRVSVCTDCPLSENRNKAVAGEGPKDADIMFIGEGPGFHEDREGRPFVGPSGRILGELIHSIGLKRVDVFISNVVKCRPPNNRDPLPVEIAACRKFLDKQLELIQPKVVVTLGRHSMGRFLPNEPIGRNRGKVRSIEGVQVYPVYHPAAALRNQNLKRVLEEDFKVIPSLVLKSSGRNHLGDETGEQLSLFQQGS